MLASKLRRQALAFTLIILSSLMLYPAAQQRHEILAAFWLGLIVLANLLILWTR